MRLPKNKEGIIKKRAEIENQLNELINSMDLSVSFDEIKEMIYNEQDQGVLHEIVSKFDQGRGIDELNKILEVVNDAWNYFPHKCLNGLSPAEKILGSQR
ncbi:MAG: hypothetical protein PHQ42_03565 [Patescibacteria group bacterium]|nr:hypothetical protein [Patescibacteria group bacterium]